MELIGVVGGLGPAATQLYYRLLVEESLRLCGERPELVIYSLRLEDVCNHARKGEWKRVAELVSRAIASLRRAGAGIALIAANTPHAAWSIYSPVAEKLGLKLVSIVEAAAKSLEKRGASRVGVLAAGLTVDAGVYGVLEDAGLEVVYLPRRLQEELDSVLMEEFVEDRVSSKGLSVLEESVKTLVGLGVDTVLVACTDLSPYIGKLPEIGVPVVDASREHVLEALRLAGCGKNY